MNEVNICLAEMLHVPVFAAQDNKKRALTTEQDRAQLEMQIQSFKQSRGLLCSTSLLMID